MYSLERAIFARQKHEQNQEVMFHSLFDLLNLGLQDLGVNKLFKLRSVQTGIEPQGQITQCISVRPATF